jgi:hypothetical protein
MAVKYCTVSDVVQVATSFEQDFIRNDQKLVASINLLITEATDIAKTILQSRYDLATIDASVPEIVKNYTANKTAMFLLIQQGVISNRSKENESLIKTIKGKLKAYKEKMMFGNILNDITPVVSRDNFAYGGFQSNTGINNLYEDGVRG